MRTHLLTLTFALFGLTGCKGKDKQADEPAPPPAAPTGTAPAAPSGSAPAPAAPSDEPPPPPAARACDLAGPYKTARVKLTMSGNQTGTLDFVDVTSQTGTELDEGGVSFSFRTASGNEKLAFTLPCKTGTSKGGLGNAQLGTGAYVVGECTFDVKKLDKTGVEGTLDCPAQKNISNQKAPPVTLVGTFTIGA